MPVVDLRTYRAMVEAAMAEAIATKKPVVFENTGPAHAGVVLEVLAANCVKSLDIVSGFLDSAAWSAESLSKFLSRNNSSQIRILLDELKDDSLPARSALLSLVPNERLVAKRLSHPLGAHLCVGDRTHVRLETAQHSAEATVTLGDSEFGARAADIFNDLWETVKDQPALSYGRQLELA